MHMIARTALAATDAAPAAAVPSPDRSWRSRLRAPCAAVLLCAHAAAGAQTAPHPVDGPSFAPMALALLLVLALIGIAVWVLRRTGIAPRSAGSPLRLVSQLPLGPRERVVVVEVGERWWLLGVGAGGITRLGTLAKGEAGPAAAPAPSFGTLLEKLRGGRS
jgi:flagellar protein FliO/FliZ